jgi:hypothetical protein
MSEERNVIPQILTGIACIFGTVGVLWYYGYLHFARPEDALQLTQFTLIKTLPGEDYKVALEPAAQVAECVDGVLVLFDTETEGSDRCAGQRQATGCALHGPANAATDSIALSRPLDLSDGPRSTCLAP